MNLAKTMGHLLRPIHHYSENRSQDVIVNITSSPVRVIHKKYQMGVEGGAGVLIGVVIK